MWQNRSLFCFWGKQFIAWVKTPEGWFCLSVWNCDLSFNSPVWNYLVAHKKRIYLIWGLHGAFMNMCLFCGLIQYENDICSNWWIPSTRKILKVRWELMQMSCYSIVLDNIFWSSLFWKETAQSQLTWWFLLLNKKWARKILIGSDPLFIENASVSDGALISACRLSSKLGITLNWSHIW